MFLFKKDLQSGQTDLTDSHNIHALNVHCFYPISSTCLKLAAICLYEVTRTEIPWTPMHGPPMDHPWVKFGSKKAFPWTAHRWAIDGPSMGEKN